MTRDSRAEIAAVRRHPSIAAHAASARALMIVVVVIALLGLAPSAPAVTPMPTAPATPAPATPAPATPAPATPAPATPALFVRHGGRAGAAHRLVLLHGLGATGRYFANRVDGAERGRGDDKKGNGADKKGVGVARDHEWWAPDLLGFGDSPHPADSAYDLDAHAAALERALAESGAVPESGALAESGAVPDALSPASGRPVLVGHSFGAVVALALAARHPERYAGVVVVSLPVFASADDARARLRAVSPMSAGIVDDDPVWHLLALMNPAIAALHAGALVQLPDDVYVDSTRHTWTSLRRSLMNGLIGVDVAALARRVHERGVPLLFIHGKRDAAAPPKNAVALAQELGAGVVVVDDDHDLFLHDPARVWREVRRFEGALP